jgi:hypothetical protein
MMRILLCFVISLLVALSSYSNKFVLSQITLSNLVGGSNVSITSMSVVGDLPWSKDVQPQIFFFQTSYEFGPELRIRMPPKLIQGANGKLWLLLINNKVVMQDGNSWRLLNIDAAQIDNLITIAPLTNGNVILLGRSSDDQENILAAVDSNGKLLWRRTGLYDSDQLNLPLLRGYFSNLIVDKDNNVYLPGTHIRGGFARIDPATGTTPQVLDIGEYRINDDSIFIYDGKLFRVEYNDGVYYWIRRPIVGGSDTKIRTSENLQNLVTSPLGILPNGGALLSKDSKLLTWMSPTGEISRQILLAGIVRHGKDVFVAIPDNEQVVIVHSNGERTEREVISKLPKNTRLIRADESGYDFLLDGSYQSQPNQLFEPSDLLIHVDRKTKKQKETKLSKDPDRRLGIEGLVTYNHLVIENLETLLLIGADPQGAFVVRISFSDK